jgi:hypothetical protein
MSRAASAGPKRWIANTEVNRTPTAGPSSAAWSAACSVIPWDKVKAALPPPLWAVTGALVGDNISNNGRRGYGYSQPRQVEHCQTRDSYHQVLTGYNVVYRYRGSNRVTTLPYEPGRFIEVQVALAENHGRYDDDRGYRQERRHRDWHGDDDD